MGLVPCAPRHWEQWLPRHKTALQISCVHNQDPQEHPGFAHVCQAFGLLQLPSTMWDLFRNWVIENSELQKTLVFPNPSSVPALSKCLVTLPSPQAPCSFPLQQKTHCSCFELQWCFTQIGFLWSTRRHLNTGSWVMESGKTERSFHLQ